MNLIQAILENNRPEIISGAGYDKEAWAKKKSEERDALFRTAEETALSCRTDPELMRSVLDLMVRFPDQSPTNILLLAAQRPQATELREYREWNISRIGVKKGETAISLLVSGGEYTRGDGTTGTRWNVKKVFDISQTYGKRTAAVQGPTLVKTAVEGMKRSVPCTLKIYGSGDPASPGKTVYDPESKVMEVTGTEYPAEMFYRLAHAEASAVLDRQDVDKELLGFGSDCVSYILCRRWAVEKEFKHIGIPPEAFTDMEARGVKRFLTEVRSAAEEIADGIDCYVRDMKEAPERDGDEAR